MISAFLASQIPTLWAQVAGVTPPSPSPPPPPPAPAPSSGGPASLSPIILSVTSPGAGEITVVLDGVPTKKSDNTDLNSANIARHWFYRKAAAAGSLGVIDINDASTYDERVSVTYPGGGLSKNFTGLASGNHYIVATCETDYAESEASFEFSLTI